MFASSKRFAPVLKVSIKSAATPISTPPSFPETFEVIDISNGHGRPPFRREVDTLTNA